MPKIPPKKRFTSIFQNDRRDDQRAGNLSEKWRIGTLPIEESLAYKCSEMHTVNPSETCTSLSRSGALARAVHKVSGAQRARLPYALRGGWLSAFTPPSVSLFRCEAQKRYLLAAGKKSTQRKRPKAAEKQPGQSPADPAEAGSTPKKEKPILSNPHRIAPKLEERQKLLSACRNASAGPCWSPAEAKHMPTLTRPRAQRAKPPAHATVEHPGDYERR